VTPKNYLNPAKDEQKSSHYRLQLKGDSAKDLYNAMRIKPVLGDCTGGLAKNIGEMQCIYFKAGKTYLCNFAINIAEQSIKHGATC
jgi:hypothetical protein